MEKNDLLDMMQGAVVQGWDSDRFLDEYRRVPEVRGADEVEDDERAPLVVGDDEPPALDEGVLGELYEQFKGAYDGRVDVFREREGRLLNRGEPQQIAGQLREEIFGRGERGSPELTDDMVQQMQGQVRVQQERQRDANRGQGAAPVGLHEDEMHRGGADIGEDDDERNRHGRGRQRQGGDPPKKPTDGKAAFLGIGGIAALAAVVLIPFPIGLLALPLIYGAGKLIENKTDIDVGLGKGKKYKESLATYQREQEAREEEERGDGRGEQQREGERAAEPDRDVDRGMLASAMLDTRRELEANIRIVNDEIVLGDVELTRKEQGVIVELGGILHRDVDGKVTGIEAAGGVDLAELKGGVVDTLVEGRGVEEFKHRRDEVDRAAQRVVEGGQRPPDGHAADVRNRGGAGRGVE